MGSMTLRKIICDLYSEEKIAGDLENYIKEVNKQFTEFCAAIGIDITNFQSKSHRYHIPQENVDLIKEIVKGYTKPPISDLRKGSFSKVMYSYYSEIEDFIQSVMKNCGRDSDEISSQLVTFRHKTGWVYQYDIQQMKRYALSKLDDFYNKATQTGCLGNDDRLVIFEAARSAFESHLDEFMSRWKEILEEFKDRRSDEITDIDTDTNQIELLQQGQEVIQLWHEFVESDSQLTDWTIELAYLQEEKKRGNQAKIIRLERKIGERKIQLKKDVQKNYTLHLNS